MKIIFMGSSDFAVPALEILQKHHNVVAVYTKAPSPSGRGLKISKTIIHKMADTYHIPVYTPKNFKNDADIHFLQSLQADMIIVAAYGVILPETILNSTVYGAFNIHGSILPRWRGAAPIHRAIMAGDDALGVTIMQMSAGLDEGDIFDIWSMPHTDDLTTGKAHDILAKQGADLLIQVIDKIVNHHLKPVPQSLDTVSYAHKIHKSECEINWNQKTNDILRFIRALNPYPSAFCFYNGIRYKIHAACAVSEKEQHQEFVFKTNDGYIRATCIQEENKNKKYL